ncbi:MAG: ribosome biogenesis factor YjgA [Gammaproteobacteria bacterium]
MSEEWDTDTGEIRRKSKQQQKREAEAAQALGKDIVELPVAQFRQVLEKLELPEKLHDAMVQCRDMKAREARRRQLQFIGKLMRDIELEPVHEVMNRLKQGGQLARAQLHQLETWRERLLNEGETALQELISLYPQADIKKIQQYVATAKHESAHKQTPRAARQLFRYLRELMQE